MYFQFLIEDVSTEILVGHIMEKLKKKYPHKEIYADTKSFSGIGHLRNSGNLMERKGGNLLNNLYMYLRAFDRALSSMDHAAIVVVVDNDKRDFEDFRMKLEQIARDAMVLTDYVFCIAIKEMEAWLLGDENAILKAYPLAKRKYIKAYEQDTICDTWEVLANAVYPGGLVVLKKKSKTSYSETGKAKCEWADRIGRELELENNMSPSFHFFIKSLMTRIEAA